MGAQAALRAQPGGLPARSRPLEVLSQDSRGRPGEGGRGGHPHPGRALVQDPEPKYGLAVTGQVHPKKVLTNAGAKPGDVLLLTKPLGSGIATTAIKRGVASKELTKRVVALMSELNQAAGRGVRLGQVQGERPHGRDGLRAAGAPAGDDDGGQGAGAAGPGAHPHHLGACRALAQQGVVPGGTKANLAHVAQEGALPQGAARGHPVGARGRADQRGPAGLGAGAATRARRCGRWSGPGWTRPSSARWREGRPGIEVVG